MGTFIYAGMGGIEVDDRTLAHLRLVISEKLRRSEGFMFDLRRDDNTGHSSFWLAPGVPLAFHPYSDRPVPLNREWLRALTASASSPQGLQLVPEPLPIEEGRG